MSLHPLFSVLFFMCSSMLLGQNTNYVLVWSDEFDGNGAINSDKWHHQTLLPNGDSWWNGEIQHYTDRTDNSNVSNGTLKIVAKKEQFTDQGVTKEYTSARLNSKFAFTYGLVEVRAKLPIGAGTWPAIWTLGQNIIEPGAFWSDDFGTVIWPACGELDIMEHWGSNQNFVQSATHTPSSSGNTVNKGGQVIPTASSQFHVYTMEWTEDKVIFSVDGVVHYTYEPAVQNSDTWPFDANQYLLLNVAVLPDIDPTFTESAMEVDYVGVYQDELLSTPGNEVDSVLVYSSLTKDTLSVRIGQDLLGAQMDVYSIAGQRIKSFTIRELTNEFDVSNLPSGTYAVVLQKGETTIRRLVVKR